MWHSTAAVKPIANASPHSHGGGPTGATIIQAKAATKSATVATAKHDASHVPMQ
jgi:hypothetical protein